jgi:hypothetical protein
MPDTLAQLKAMPADEQDKRLRQLVSQILWTGPAEGIPCSHSGCLFHITHPCEGCGRVAGRIPEFQGSWADAAERLLEEAWKQGIEDELAEADAILHQDSGPGGEPWYKHGTLNPRKRVICLLMALGALKP